LIVLLLTYNQWFGSSRVATLRGDSTVLSKKEIVGIFSRLSLPEAIAQVHEYQKAYNARYVEVTAIEFELVSVSEIPDLPDSIIQLSGSMLIEKHLKVFLEED